MLELPQYKFVAKTALLWARSFIIFANLLVTFQKPQQWICILLEIFANEPLLHLHIINYNRALGWLHCTWILLDCSASMCGQLSSLLYLCATIQVLRKYEQALSQTKVLLRQTVQLQCQSEASGSLPKRSQILNVIRLYRGLQPSTESILNVITANTRLADVRCVLGWPL